MTLIEFTIARAFSQLKQAKKQRELTEVEAKELELLAALVEGYRRRAA